MKFIVVNHRTPLDRSTCAACSRSFGSGYLKSVATRRSYCDHDCYLRGESRSPLTSWLATVPFEMMMSFATASCCYSIAMMSATLHASELMTVDISDGDRRRRS